jgi:hypothetical protein
MLRGEDWIPRSMIGEWIMSSRVTLYLAVRDAESVARRAGVAQAMRDMPYGTADEYAAMRDAAAEWAAIRDTVQEDCGQCGARHDALWTVRRVVADTLGPWNVYRVAGSGRTLPGGGLPMTLDKLPRDAARVQADAAARFWHAD